METVSKNKRVVVAMSGGVDSSVAAALLQEQGYDVIGISLKLWDYDEAQRKVSGKTCCSIEDIADAKSVCDTLGIPFYAFNHKKKFQEKVIDSFVSEYLVGRTPNPCVLCNQFIKFGLLLEEAQKLGASYLATGHYARILCDGSGHYHLHKARDTSKDQSYVLFHLQQSELARILFPLGDMTKEEVRRLAERYNLVTHNKKESQDICFVPDNDHGRFIRSYVAEEKLRGPGNIVDRQGNILGEHEGIESYTVGQRKGLKFAAGRRLYVTAIDAQKNEVVLGDENDVWQGGLVAERFHFLTPPETDILSAKIRYQRDDIPTRIESYSGESLRVQFPQKARAVTPGQAIVLYKGDEVIGGGWIREAF